MASRKALWYSVAHEPQAHRLSPRGEVFYAMNGRRTPRFPRLRRVAALALAGLGLLTLAGCPTDGKRDTFDYLRSPVNFRMDPVADDHPFCSDPDQRMGLSE